MRASEADVLINAVKTFVLFSLRTNVSFLLKVQNKMDPRTRKKSKEGCNWPARNGVVQLDFPVNRSDGCLSKQWGKYACIQSQKAHDLSF